MGLALFQIDSYTYILLFHSPKEIGTGDFSITPAPKEFRCVSIQTYRVGI